MAHGRGDELGELEQMVLLATLRLGERAYGVPIIEALDQATARAVSRPSVYVALVRLRKKGLLASTLGDPTPQRGGRAKRFYRVTPAGLRRLRASRRTYLTLWSGLEPLLDRR
ncbi:MAG: PadR family transcriptional regulator [Vicinamibacteraceae bacterium]